MFKSLEPLISGYVRCIRFHYYYKRVSYQLQLLFICLVCFILLYFKSLDIIDNDYKLVRGCQGYIQKYKNCHLKMCTT